MPSTFDLQFIAADKLYRFGFKLDDERIIEEWLCQVIGNRQKLLYERTTNKNGEVTINAEGLKGAADKLMALATGRQKADIAAVVCLSGTCASL